MKADLTRDSLDLDQHYSFVLMQQGRVQLDADWNEQGALLLEATRRLARDTGPLAGTAGGPYSITPMAAPHEHDLEITPGTVYVDGIACNAAPGVARLLADTPTNPWVTTSWRLDGVEFAEGQLLRTAWDPVIAVGPLLTITGVDTARRTLNVDQPGFARPAGQGLRFLAGVRRVPTYLTQRDLPHAPELPTVPAQFYLDVWERLVTPIEDDAIREVALDGASTTDRAQVVCQLKWMPIPAGFLTDTCLTPDWIAWTLRGGHAGTLRARVQPTPTSTDPCTAAPGSPYRGTENQLYRVEVNTGTLDDQGRRRPATFKWSRDNGSVTFPVLSVKPGSTTTTVVLASLGPDDRFGIDQGQLVEVCDDESVLKQRPGQLLRVQSVERVSRTVVLAGALVPDGARVVGTDAALHPLLRRWDHGAATDAADAPALAADGCLTIVPASVLDSDAAWTELEDGVQILFENYDANASYRCGDYWLAPARIATADLIWRRESGMDAQGNPVSYPAARAPDGIRHHYAPVAVYDPGAKPVVRACMATAAARKRGGG